MLRKISLYLNVFIPKKHAIMKRLLIIGLLILIFPYKTFGQIDLVEQFNSFIKPTELAQGFHAVDLFTTKKISEKKKIYADEEGIHFALVLTEGTNESPEKNKDMFFKFKDIKKLVILPKDKALYGHKFVDDFQVLVHFKQIGRLMIIGLNEKRVEPFIALIKLIQPKLKKVTYVEDK